MGVAGVADSVGVADAADSVGVADAADSVGVAGVIFNSMPVGYSLLYHI